MIGRKLRRGTAPGEDTVGPKGFDDFALRLGDVMRGERATMGKSLLDVQRELRIKASYIAAIENCDPEAFDTPGFIAGYVRSYARYLGMDPDATFQKFCFESGFTTAHGMSAEASSQQRKPGQTLPQKPAGERDLFKDPHMPFAPRGESLLAQIEPGAIGSMAVLLTLIAGIGYGGWSVLQEIQRVQLTPVDQTPIALAELDPLEGAGRITPEGDSLDPDETRGAGVFAPPSGEPLDRLYRPQALDVPVMIARDAPISTLDPSRVGSFANASRERAPSIVTASAAASGDVPLEQVMTEVAEQVASTLPQVLEAPKPGVQLVAVRPAWVRVRAADGSVLYEAVMNAGDTYDVPQGEEPATLRVGASGAVYFAVNGQTYGPAGPRGAVTSNVALAAASLTDRYQPADPASDGDLEKMVAQLNLRVATPAPEADSE
ncbi:helix-turn-helix domain-containing protein [Marinovum sp.]|uniref:helix-turn-helix domain-containing protein n=1 Tax=Marinovum sp. TaxID=2024839 RepID=UPI002B275C94|nr:helix-turn-helix domain-containing protein [Marinovum sp.]